MEGSQVFGDDGRECKSWSYPMTHILVLTKQLIHQNRLSEMFSKTNMTQSQYIQKLSWAMQTP